MNESGNVIAIAFDRPEVLDHQLVGRPGPAAVLVISFDGKYFEPDALQVHPGDVLPRENRFSWPAVLNEG